jgi:Zn-dependent protease
MRDFASWSINLGRWYGVALRLHAFFLLFALFTLYLAAQSPAPGALGYAGLSLGILLLSVLLHEIGHTWAALHVGGAADQIVLGPLGGLAWPQVPHEPQCERLTAAAGPLVNAVVCLLVAPLLWGAGVNVAGLFNPLAPVEVVTGTSGLIIGLKLTFWINWVLLLVNLLPAFPLDGARIVRSLLWPTFDFRAAVQILTIGARLLALGLVVAAVLVRHETASGLVPAWLPLVLLAMVVYFSAQQEAQRVEEQELDDALVGYDFSQGYTTLERHVEPPEPTPGPLRRRLDRWRRSRQLRQQLLEQQEERQVDEILVRLHASGLGGLTAKERALLERVSARLRNRQRSS